VKINILFILILFALSISCKNKNNTFQQINPYSELISNPISANNEKDTVNIPKLFFPESRYDFGTVSEGDSVVHNFSFYNRGNAPLLITNVASSCGCTVPKLYKNQLEPGDSSILRVLFNTKDKINDQEKRITIYANTFPTETEIILTGFVNK
jgi:hypothetical protein